MVVLSGTFLSFGLVLLRSVLWFYSDLFSVWLYSDLILWRADQSSEFSQIETFFERFALENLQWFSHRTVDLKLPKEMENGIRTIEALPQDAEIKPMSESIGEETPPKSHRRQRNTAEESPASNH